MGELASISEILQATAAEVAQPVVLQDCLKADSADECEVPEGQQPSQALVCVAGVSERVDPADSGVANGGVLEARPLGQRSPPSGSPSSPEYSATSPECSESERAEQHHRRAKRIGDKPPPARIPRKPEHKRPAPYVAPAPKKATPRVKLTDQQKRARDAEREAVKAKRDDLESLQWHDKNCCKICFSATHYWLTCPVQYCACTVGQANIGK